MNYEIIATIGPVSRRPEALAAMMAAGVSAFRINTSHLCVEDFGEWELRVTTYLSTFSFAKEAMFKDLQDNEERHSLMTAPVSEIRRQLEYLAQIHGDATPEHRLLQRYIRFEQNRERIFGYLSFGFGGPGGPPPDSNGPRRGSPPKDRL